MHVKDLHAASFRGAGFLVPNDTTQEGRNSIIHDYPDQAMRYVEDNGAIPPCFDVTAILHGPNLVSDLARLRNALSRPGPGVLKHPVFGTQFVMVDQQYSIRHTQRNSGVIELSIKFITTGAPIFPGLLSGVAAFVSQISDTAISNAFNAFLENFQSPDSPPSIIETADAISEIASTLQNEFSEVSGDVKQLIKKSGLFAQDMSLVGDLWFSAFRAPIDDETITNTTLISGFNNVRKSAKSIIDKSKILEPTTVDLIARKQSLFDIGSYCEFASFISMAESMASREYETGEQVDVDEILLFDGFSDLQNRGLPADQHAEMFDVYIATTNILSKSAVRLPRITDIDANGTPASVLSYQLYEHDGLNHAELPGRTSSIIGLNPNKNPSFLENNTSVLTRNLSA